MSARLGCLSAGCSTISTYDQVAYEHATNAKVDALALMDKATGDYSAHREEIATVVLELKKAYEYDKGRPLNERTLQQWDVMMNPERDLFARLPPGLGAQRTFQTRRAHGTKDQSRGRLSIRSSAWRAAN